MALAILLVIIVNKSMVYILPEIKYEKYTMSWFAAKIPYAAIRLSFTFLLAYFFIGFKNIVGRKKFSWYFLGLIPIMYYLIRPGLVDYQQLELSSTILAVVAMLIGVTQEELFSRGILYNYIMQKTNDFVAILLSSLIFGLLHHSWAGADRFSMDALVGNAFPPFILGLIFCTVYHFSKSLPLAIILHLIWNITNMFWSSTALLGYWNKLVPLAPF